MAPPPPFPQPLRGALFDLDGTLADTEPLHHESAARVLARYGVLVPAGALNGYVGWAELPFWDDLKQRHGLAAAAATLADERTAAYLALLHGRILEPLPGILALLAELRARGVPCAIASSAPRAQIAASLRAAGLEHAFPHRVSGHDDVRRGKPAPDVYLAAAAALGVEPAACIAIEDSATGLAAALAAGTYAVAIPGPGQNGPGMAGAHLRLASATELAALLAAGGGGTTPDPAAPSRTRTTERRCGD